MFSLLKIFFKYGRRRVFVFINNTSGFRDNCKYAYMAISKKFPDAKLIWIAVDAKDARDISQMGIKTYSKEKNKICLLLLVLFAKYHFTTNGLGLAYLDIAGFFGNKVFNFWHGAQGRYFAYYNIGELQPRPFWMKWLVKRSAKHLFTVNGSDYINKYVRRAFRMCEFNSPLLLGQPRIRPLITPIEKVDEFITENDTFLKQLKKERQHFKTVYCYAPTYRDNGANFLKELHLDIDKLNEVLAKKNALMIFKMHPLCNLQNTKHLSNIRCADKYTDIYPLVAMCDVVVGDYSSLYFDVLVCKDKKQILLHGDIKKYRQKCRNINEEHLADMTKGLVLDDFRDLIRFIEGKIKYITPPKEIMEKHWDKKVIENPDCYMSHIK